jgi:hypothetical protein
MFATGPRVRVERGPMEACLHGEYRWGLTPAQGCHEVGLALATWDVSAAVALLTASCEADQPDEASCRDAVRVTRAAATSGLWAELTSDDIRRVRSLCDHVGSFDACSELADWSRAVGAGTMRPLGTILLDGSDQEQAHLPALVDEMRPGRDVRAELARQMAVEGRQQWAAARARARAAEQARIAAHIAAVGVGLTLASQQMSATTRPSLGPGVVARADTADTGGGVCADNGESCASDPSVTRWGECRPDTTAQRACYCRTYFTAQCFIDHDCYAEAGAATSVTRARLESTQASANDMAGQLGPPCM